MWTLVPTHIPWMHHVDISAGQGSAITLTTRLIALQPSCVQLPYTPYYLCTLLPYNHRVCNCLSLYPRLASDTQLGLRLGPRLASDTRHAPIPCWVEAHRSPTSLPSTCTGNCKVATLDLDSSAANVGSNPSLRFPKSQSPDGILILGASCEASCGTGEVFSCTSSEFRSRLIPPYVPHCCAT